MGGGVMKEWVKKRSREETMEHEGKKRGGGRRGSAKKFAYVTFTLPSIICVLFNHRKHTTELTFSWNFFLYSTPMGDKLLKKKIPLIFVKATNASSHRLQKTGSSASIQRFFINIILIFSHTQMTVH
jgi:hypothetical protein